MKGGLSPLRSNTVGPIRYSCAFQLPRNNDGARARAHTHAKPRKRSIYREDQSFSRFRTTRNAITRYSATESFNRFDRGAEGGGNVGRVGDKEGAEGKGERDRAVDGRRVRA